MPTKYRPNRNYKPTPVEKLGNAWGKLLQRSRKCTSS